MTAVIGILNKNAIALAADSAVTVSGSNGRKIYNTANKIFTISKYHPVSIVVYNSANFITTPWEIIIKIYRNELGAKSFPHLKNYSDDFFEFLKNKNFFSTKETIKHFTQSLIFSAFEGIKESAIEDAFDNKESLISMSLEERVSLFRNNVKQILDAEISDMKNEEKLIDFKSLTKKRFSSLIKNDLDEIIDLEFFFTTKASLSEGNGLGLFLPVMETMIFTQ
jgi:hypothetical protein